MMRVASIVEGHGEVEALPVLLRALATSRQEAGKVSILRPIRVRRDRFLNREEEFHRQMFLAARMCGVGGWVLVLLDADDDCPAQLAPKIAARALPCAVGCDVSVVLANREFEAWFIAAAESLDGARGFRMRAGDESVDAEATRDAKGWLRKRMDRGTYSEILDQSRFAARMDFSQAIGRSRSFRKLCKEWEVHVSGATA